MIALLALIPGSGCRETGPAPQPKNRAEATQLEKQGHSFAARHRPAWVDEPRPRGAAAPTTMPAGWVPAGRGAWVLGRMELKETQALGSLVAKSLQGMRVRLRAPFRPCPGERSLVLLDDPLRRLVARLPGEIPPGIADQRAVFEGELRLPSSEEERRVVGRCLGQPPGVMLQVTGALVRVAPSGRER